MQKLSNGLKIALNKKSIKFNVFIVVIILMLQACANMLAPTGGQKDTLHPKLVKSYPENYSKNFNGKNIEIEFNEYIVLKDIQNQLIVSPGNIETNVKKSGKKIIIDFKNELLPNTTYIINFGNSISDYTESNINKEFKFIFSTGDVIDSLNISGRLIDAFKTDAIKEALICLYTDVINDSIIYLSKPTYTTKTDDDGNFIFTNLKENKYKIIALTETNNNKIYDSQEEQLAFIDTTINLSKNTDLNLIKLFKEIPTKTKILDKKIEYQKVDLIFNKKYADYTFVKTDSLVDTIVYNKTKDSVSLYYKTKLDSSSFILNYDNKYDTIKYKFAKNLKPRNFTIDINSRNDSDKLIIYTSNKIKEFIKDSINLFEDSIRVNFNLRIKLNQLELIYDFDTYKKYYIVLKDSSVIDFQNQKNKKIKKDIEFYKEEDFGIIELKFKGDIKNKIIEVYNDKGITVCKTELNKINNIKINKLNAGTYKVRIITDINNNGKWDTGNYLKKIQPEPVEYYKEDIKVRANWELELEINL